MEKQSVNKLAVDPEQSFNLNKYKLSKLSAVEKENYVDSMCIIYPLINNILLDMEECRSSSHRLNEVNCMFLSGDTRYGKTSIAKIYMHSHPDIETEEITLKPILYVKVPSPAYTGSLKSNILQALGDPFYAKTLSHFQSNDRIIKLLAKCKVELIILDEFQHLVEGNRHKVLIESSDWFKNLIDDCKISVVFTGLPDAEKVLIENKQLGNRVRIRRSIEPFAFDDKEFRILLYNFDKQLPFEEMSGLAEYDTWQRIYLATGGILGNIKSLLLKATGLAALQNLSCISDDILFQAYNSRLHHLSSDNPFSPMYNLKKAIRCKNVNL